MTKPLASQRVKVATEIGSTVLSVLTSVAVLAWLMYQWSHAPHQKQVPLPAAPVSVSNAERVGNPAAPLIVIEYSDFECPFCGRFARDSFPRLLRDYVDKGLAQWAFAQHPLDTLHPHALAAALAATCAARQGRFLQMHDALFADQTHLDHESILARARTLGLDVHTFESCLGDPAVADRVHSSSRTAQSLGLSGTPAFLIGRLDPTGNVRVTKVVDGAMPDEIETALTSGDGHKSAFVGGGLLAAGFVVVAFLWFRGRSHVNTWRSA